MYLIFSLYFPTKYGLQILRLEVWYDDVLRYLTLGLKEFRSNPKAANPTNYVRSFKSKLINFESLMRNY